MDTVLQRLLRGSLTNALDRWDERVCDLIVDYLRPDGLGVPSMMSREDVTRVPHTMLDSDNEFTRDWSQLAEVRGRSRPTDTEDERAALLEPQLGSVSLIVEPIRLMAV